jgi:hypothetical protein
MGYAIHQGARNMRTPHLDILKRQSDGGFVWIEAASDIRMAEQRISQLACDAPGEYFVFDQRSQQIVTKIARQQIIEGPQCAEP